MGGGMRCAVFDTACGSSEEKHAMPGTDIECGTATRRKCNCRSRCCRERRRGQSQQVSHARNQGQDTTISTQFVQGIWLLALDIAGQPIVRTLAPAMSGDAPCL
eukprot:629953-Rhodomonas_salina.1